MHIRKWFGGNSPEKYMVTLESVISSKGEVIRAFRAYTQRGR